MWMGRELERKKKKMKGDDGGCFVWRGMWKEMVELWVDKSSGVERSGRWWWMRWMKREKWWVF